MLMEECNYKPADLMCVQEILQSVVKVFRYFQSKHTRKNGILKKKNIYISTVHIMRNDALHRYSFVQ